MAPTTAFFNRFLNARVGGREYGPFAYLRYWVTGGDWDGNKRTIKSVYLGKEIALAIQHHVAQEGLDANKSVHLQWLLENVPIALELAKELNRNGREGPQRKKFGRVSVGKSSVAIQQTEILPGTFYF